MMGSDATRELRAFRDQLVGLQKDTDSFLHRCAVLLGERLNRLARKRTPVWNPVKTRAIIEHGEETGHKWGLMPRSATDRVKTADQIWAEYWAGRTGGTLRKAWKVGEPTVSSGTVRVEVKNSTKYASYVELGHRQTPGRYVPALGVFLKKPWVPGQHMLELSEQELKPKIPGILQRELDAWLRKGMK